MMLESKKTILDAVNEADYILVGIGEEWTPTFEEMLTDPVFSRDLAAFPDYLMNDFAVLMLTKKYLEEFHSEKRKKAYENLFHLCREKNYFLISVCQDKYPIMAGFESEKCVFPCGNYELLQCEENCHNSLMNAGEEYYRFLKEYQNNTEYKNPKCPFCDAPLVFNRAEAKKYCEGGYLEQWQNYMKFLANTVNRKLCILELGVSMRYPEIIRNAFERTIIYSKKANLFRIHHSLTDLPELIQDRSYVKKEDSVSYMSNLFVS